MACCGGGTRPQRIRKQVVGETQKSSALVQRKLSRTPHVAKPVEPRRQYVMPREQCTKCGYPGMLVTIAGRERMQCSNVNCRLLIN